MANNRNNGWHRGNGSPVPHWFKEHIEWMKANVERMDEENKRRDKDIAIAKIEAKSAIAIAEKLGVDVRELKKRLRMI